MPGTPHIPAVYFSVLAALSTNSRQCLGKVCAARERSSYGGKREWRWHLWRETGVTVAFMTGNESGGGIYGGKREWRWHLWRKTGVTVAFMARNRSDGGIYGGKQVWRRHLWRATGVTVAFVVENGSDWKKKSKKFPALGIRICTTIVVKWNLGRLTFQLGRTL